MKPGWRTNVEAHESRFFGLRGSGSGGAVFFESRFLNKLLS